MRTFTKSYPRKDSCAKLFISLLLLLPRAWGCCKYLWLFNPHAVYNSWHVPADRLQVVAAHNPRTVTLIAL